MVFEKGNWVVDTKNNQPFWITALAFENTFLMGWGVRQGVLHWLTTSALKDSPYVMEDSDVTDFIASEMDVDGMTPFKTIMNNPDDYLFKNITKYGKEDETYVEKSVARENAERGIKAKRHGVFNSSL